MNDTLLQTPGQIIKAAREARQISLNDVTQGLLLSKKIITAIEEDDYSKIAASVYAEGYLKAYAKFLQIPSENILTSFRRLNIYSNGNIIKVRTETQSKVNISWLLKLLRYFKEHLKIVSGIGVLIVILGITGFVYKMVKSKNITDESNPIISQEYNAQSLEQVVEHDAASSLDLSVPLEVVKSKSKEKKDNQMVVE
ncbi:MAG: helix-turn-helix domain-containing protein [Coxiellaceae bacterium]|jgi:cytoskeletal protein RodZ|nr:helix-turn-helix domain-containing protein [Coxiellaceae bacterium]